MPNYDYACSRCGSFTARRPMAEALEPSPCPTCGATSERSLSLPSLGAGTRAASGGAAHLSGCACCAPSGGGFRAE
jgi:putative FmdB family regulatory protein